MPQDLAAASDVGRRASSRLWVALWVAQHTPRYAARFRATLGDSGLADPSRAPLRHS